MHNMVSQTYDSTQPPAVFLSREELAAMDHAFLLYPGNASFLQGTSKRSSGGTTLITPLILLILGAFVAGLVAAMASNASSGRTTLWIVSAIIALIFLIGVALGYRAYLHDKRFNAEGK